jgi:hypothetical protein
MRPAIPLLALALALLCPVSIGAATEAIDEELARFYEASIKLQKTYDDAEAREKARSVPALASLAKREAAQGNMAAASDGWRQVLILDPQHEEARKFFTATNQLDKILAEVAKHQGPFIGKGEPTVAKVEEAKVDMAGARQVRVTAQHLTGSSLGSFKKGTVVAIQYVSGAWSAMNPDGAAKVNQSPDEPGVAAMNVAVLYMDSGNEPLVLAQIPTGTAAKPFVYTLDRDVSGLTLRITGVKALGLRAMTYYTGDVRYLVKISMPGR